MKNKFVKKIFNAIRPRVWVIQTENDVFLAAYWTRKSVEKSCREFNDNDIKCSFAGVPLFF